MPARKITCRLIESLLPTTVADKVCGAAAREDVGAVSHYRTCLDDVERQWRQHQVTTRTLLTGVTILDAPHSIWADMLPFHAGNLVTALTGQEQQLHQIAKVTLARLPYSFDFIV